MADLNAEEIATEFCREVAELSDRGSPEGWPEAMLVTADELRSIVLAALQTVKPQAQPAAYLVTNLPSGEPSLCFEDERGDYGNEQFTPVFEPLYLAAPAQATIDAREQEEAEPVIRHERSEWGRKLAALASLDAAPAPAEDGGVTDERAAFEADYMRRFNKPGYLGPDGAGGYGHSLTQARWEGWCSRAALALAQPAPVPYAWAVSGIGTPFYGDFAEQDAHSVARHVGGNAYAFPLYRAAPVQQEAAGDAINDIIRDASESEAPDMCDTSAITIRVDDLRVLLERHLCIVGDEGRAA